MARDSHTYSSSYQMAYEPDSGAPLSSDVLAWVRFSPAMTATSDPRIVNVGLAQIGAADMAEVWRSRLPVTHGWSEGLGYAYNGEVLFGQLRLEQHEIADLDRATTQAYLRIEQLLSQRGYPCWLRIWNFLGDINLGEGEDERYRQFSRGRYNVFADKAGFEIRLPAATAIGTRDQGLTICFLAAREPGEQVENPRQVSAFHYPAEYGLKSPSFSRATLMHWADGIHLFVSGTASVVGHQSLHLDDALQQLDETHRNFEALLQQATALKPTAQPFRATALKIFIRKHEHYPLLLQRARALFGEDVPLLWLAGDICRRDLLVEIEGLFTASPLQASGRRVA